MSLVLALDGSDRPGGVALAGQGPAAPVHRAPAAGGLSEELFGLVDALLAEAGATRAQLSAVATVLGPGSYTGLRIAAMAAKSLAWAGGRPLHAAPTLDLLAAVAPAGRPCLALAAAGRGALYAQAFGPADGGGARGPAGPASRVALDALGATLAGLPREATVVTAPGLERPAGTAGDWVEAGPLAAQLAQLVAASHPVAPRVEPALLVPIYLGPSQAERAHGVDLSGTVHRPVPPRSRER